MFAVTYHMICGAIDVSVLAPKLLCGVVVAAAGTHIFPRLTSGAGQRSPELVIFDGNNASLLEVYVERKSLYEV